MTRGNRHSPLPTQPDCGIRLLQEGRSPPAEVRGVGAVGEKNIGPEVQVNLVKFSLTDDITAGHVAQALEDVVLQGVVGGCRNGRDAERKCCRIVVETTVVSNGTGKGADKAYRKLSAVLPSIM